MRTETFNKVTADYTAAIKDNPFNTGTDFDKGAHVGYALAIEDALFFLSRAIFEECATTPALIEKAAAYVKDLDSKRTLRKMLGLPGEFGATLVK